MCDVCRYLSDEDPVKLDQKVVLDMIATRMKNAKGKALDHLTELVDRVIGFKEPVNQETPSGLMQNRRNRS
jgi:hypothetical protein